MFDKSEEPKFDTSALLFNYPTYLIVSLTHTYPIATTTNPVKFVYSTYV